MRNSLVMIIVLAATTSVPLAAQDGMRRRSDANGQAAEEPQPLTIRPVAFDAAHPFAGVWVGKLNLPEDAIPYTMVIQFLNGAYDGFSAPGNPPRVAIPHQRTTIARDTMRWTQQNMGTADGLLFTVVLTDQNTLKGTMVFTDGGAPPATFTLLRQKTVR